ncbi:DUF423 domain-containing protein [Methylobacterium nodulans]|uniref:DUF423 domain-containing protein n=1 Tax=Methylobacterium nodulans (strain LMG 21967 / CNCM I-2342 / ORS 2060) TaxID=460265 RepID=B8IMN1_METNO|nr:DUF423 domain-containing protein [Methylobacterium nodulans]ACL60224.1 protein of unknown function DUF423 [Methylobacterium nodulans ORS 2060]
MPLLDRVVLALGALSGLLGVALAAASAHLTHGGSLQTAAQFLLVHAGPLLALAGLAGSERLRPGLARLAALALILGLALFCGDLALRALAQKPLFPMAAPTGGILMMLGWAVAAVAALWPPRR